MEYYWRGTENNIKKSTLEIFVSMRYNGVTNVAFIFYAHTTFACATECHTVGYRVAANKIFVSSFGEINLA